MKKTEKQVVKEEEKEQTDENGVKYINLTPNWENTTTWLHLCKQILSQKERKANSSNLFKKIQNKSQEEQFDEIYKFTVEEMKRIEKRLETLKSVAEISAYEKALCHEKGEKA